MLDFMDLDKEFLLMIRKREKDPALLGFIDDTLRMIELGDPLNLAELAVLVIENYMIKKDKEELMVAHDLIAAVIKSAEKRS